MLFKHSIYTHLPFIVIFDPVFIKLDVKVILIFQMEIGAIYWCDNENNILTIALIPRKYPDHKNNHDGVNIYSQKGWG